MEGRDESARSGIDMDAHLECLLSIYFRDHAVDIPDGIVLASVVVTHNANHGDGIFVDRVANVFGIHLEGVYRRLDQPRLDIHILKELLPGGLVTGGDDDIRLDSQDLRMGEAVSFGSPFTPSKFQSEPRKEAGFSRTDRARAGEGLRLRKMRWLRAMPESSKHVDDAVVELVRLWINGLICEVHPQSEQSYSFFFGLECDVDVR